MSNPAGVMIATLTRQRTSRVSLSSARSSGGTQSAWDKTYPLVITTQTEKLRGLPMRTESDSRLPIPAERISENSTTLSE